MSRRNLMAVLTAAAMVSGMLAGCGSQGDDVSVPPEGTKTEKEEKTVLREMVWGNIGDYTPSNDAFLEECPDIAEKVEITVELGGGGDADVAEKFRLMLASGEELPDLIRLNYTQFAEFADAGVLYDLTEAVEPYEADIMDSAKELMKYDGTYYAVIQEIKPKVWFYRSDIFEECGIDVSQVKTLDDFIEAGNTIREKYPDSFIENYGTPLNNYDMTMMLCATDGTFCDEEGNYQCASDEGVRAAFENLKKLKDSGAFSDLVEWSADWQAAFSGDTLISQLTGGWMKDHLMNWTPENSGKWAVAPWPEEIAKGSESGGGIWVIPKDAPHAELAAEVIARFAYDPQVRKDVYDLTGKIPPLVSASEDEYYLSSEYFGDMSGYFEALEQFSVYPYNPSSSQEITIVGGYLTQYLDGAMDLDKALEAADSDLQNQIGNPYE